jgi:uncharacterized NAD-dependent epimerase/dehydratase family protein
MRGLPHYGLPTLEQVRDTALHMALLANPRCKVVGYSINTQAMGEDEAQTYLADVETRLGLPATDPFRYGAGKLCDALDVV